MISFLILRRRVVLSHLSGFNKYLNISTIFMSETNIFFLAKQRPKIYFFILRKMNIWKRKERGREAREVFIIFLWMVTGLCPNNLLLLSAFCCFFFFHFWNIIMYAASLRKILLIILGRKNENFRWSRINYNRHVA